MAAAAANYELPQHQFGFAKNARRTAITSEGYLGFRRNLAASMVGLGRARVQSVKEGAPIERECPGGKQANWPPSSQPAGPTGVCECVRVCVCVCMCVCLARFLSFCMYVFVLVCRCYLGRDELASSVGLSAGHHHHRRRRRLSSLCLWRAVTY